MATVAQGAPGGDDPNGNPNPNPNSDNNDDDEPKIIGNYEVIRAIGKGKFAVVYRAKRISDGEVVALKRIKVDAIDAVAREKCLKEIRLLQSLDHPNIIRYLDSFISDNDLVIIIEWAAAGDLKRQLRKAQERGVGFEERIIWKYFSQICDAMQHMHERRIMHRDLKPANIFLTLDGTIKVGDLGLSRELSEHTFQAHSKVGTPLYMSPEVLRGDGYDFKSDVWSLGCLLYELAMLKSPFRSEGLNLYSLFQKIASGEYQPLPDNYSEQLRSLAYSMISTNSEDRPELSHICAVAAAMRAQTAKRSSANGSIPSVPDEQGTQGQMLAADSQPLIGQQAAFSAPTMPEHNGALRNSGNEKMNNAKTSSTKVSRRTVTEDEKAAGIREEAAEIGRRQPQQTDHEENAQKKKSPSKFVSGRGTDTKTATEVAEQPRNSRRDSKPSAGVKSEEQEPLRNKNTELNAGYRPTKTDVVEVGADNKLTNNQRTTKPGIGSWENITDTEFINVMDEASRPRAGLLDGSKTKPVPYLRPKKEEKKEDQHSKSKPTSTGVKPTNRSTKSRREDSNSNSSNNNDDNDNEIDNDKSDDDTVAAGNKGNARSAAKQTTTSTVEHLEKASGALALMEIVHGKLCVLGYESFGRDSSQRRAKVLPIHFAVDLNQMGRIAGTASSSSGAKHKASQHYYPQFAQMIDVAVFLFAKIGGPAAELTADIDVTRDAPMTVCKQLLSAANAAGIPSADLAEVLPTSLIAGFGDRACIFLNLLCDAALAGKPLLPLDYHTEDGKLGGMQEDVDNDMEEIADEDDPDDLAHVAGAGQAHLLAEASVDGDDMDGADVSALSMLLPSVDPAIWKQETERVSELLRAGMHSHTQSLSSLALGAVSWAENYQRLRHLSGIWLDGNQPVDRVAASDITASTLSDLVAGVQRDLTNDRNAITRGEGYVNNTEKLRELCGEYAIYKKEVVDKQSRVSALTKRVDESSVKLSKAEEQLEDLVDKLNARVGNDNGSDGAGGGSSENMLKLKLKEAIRSVKEEIKGMDLQTGLLGHNLLSKRAKEAHRRALYRSEQRRKQANKGPGGKFASGKLKRNEDTDDHLDNSGIIDELDQSNR